MAWVVVFFFLVSLDSIYHTVPFLSLGMLIFSFILQRDFFFFPNSEEKLTVTEEGRCLIVLSLSLCFIERLKSTTRTDFVVPSVAGRWDQEL